MWGYILTILTYPNKKAIKEQEKELNKKKYTRKQLLKIAKEMKEVTEKGCIGYP